MREMRKYRDYLIEELSDPEEATSISKSLKKNTRKMVTLSHFC